MTILITFSFHRVALAWLVLIPAAYLSVSAMMVLTGLSAVGGLLLQIGPVERLAGRSDPGLSCTEIIIGRRSQLVCRRRTAGSSGSINDSLPLDTETWG